jgi:spore photoproduct lyase
MALPVPTPEIRPAAPHLNPAPHLDMGAAERMLDPEQLAEILPTRAPKRWRPKRVLITPAALRWPLAARVAERAAALGAEVTELPANRLTGLRGATDRETYALAKSTLAVVEAPPSKRRLQPIPPSADWRVDLAEGCPAHCQYCYLAGSLAGPPVTRVYANLPEILGALADYGPGGPHEPTTRRRDGEGVTFEASCYTDPLALEELTGSLAETVTHFGSWDADVGLRWTTKFDAVGPLLDLDHRRRTRIRFSVNAESVTRRVEGGTAALTERLTALGRVARAGYPVGLTIAPIFPIPDWRAGYGQLLRDAAATVAGIANLDLTVELITHRFTAGSRDVLLSWYPRTHVEMDPAQRVEKRTKFGSVKYVLPKEAMRELRSWFEAEIAAQLPAARLLYWT